MLPFLPVSCLENGACSEARKEAQAAAVVAVIGSLQLPSAAIGSFVDDPCSALLQKRPLGKGVLDCFFHVPGAA